MPPSLGVNLRVTGHCNQGGRKYMEDVFSVAYQQTNDEKDLEYAFFGIFDGHGGREAAQYSKDHLMDAITKNKLFWSEEDDLVLKAIRDVFLSKKQAMWNELPNWKKTATGLPSTAGTTASICFIKRGKLFIGHVGDSGIILGERDPTHPSRWRAKPLTREHKPECEIELARIEAAGGKVMSKSGVPRVVWYRPSNGAKHQGPVRRSTHFDEVPFLAVARALGDLWSYNSKQDVFVVSPDPDLRVFDLNVLKDRCLVLATDGAWNVLSPDMAVEEVFAAERNNEKHMINPQGGHTWVNPSKRLVDLALDRWKNFKLRADNTSIVTVMLDPPGPPRAQVLRRLYGVQSPKLQNQPQPATLNDPPQRTESVQDCLSKHQISGSQSNDNNKREFDPAPQRRKNEDTSVNDTEKGNEVSSPTKAKTYKSQHRNHCDDNEGPGAIAIISRFPNSKRDEEQLGRNLVALGDTDENAVSSGNLHSAARIVHDSIKTVPLKMRVVPPKVPTYLVHPPPPPRSAQVTTSCNVNTVSRQSIKGPICPSQDTGAEVEEQIPSSTSNGEGTKVCSDKEKIKCTVHPVSSPLQINVVTSSDDEKTPPPVPQRPPGGHGATNKRRSLCRELADLQNNASSLISGPGDTKRKTVVSQANQLSGAGDVGRSTRSRHGGTTFDKDHSSSEIVNKNITSIQPLDTCENIAMASSNIWVSKKPPRRSVVMPAEEGSESPTYNSDSENHQPATVQLRSHAARRSTSVPHQKSRGDLVNSSRRTSSSSNIRGKNTAELAVAEMVSTNSHLKGPRNDMPSSMVKQMAVNMNNRSAQLPQQPPPLPARTALRSSAGQQKILQSANISNMGKPVVESKSLPAKPTNNLPNISSPRVLRPRNTPSTSSNTQQQPIPLNSSKVISTPNNRIAIRRDSGKSVPSKITARTVRFFEDSIKNGNETGLKRKRRSFDTSTTSVPTHKSAKLIRTGHTTRSCTWNNQTLCSKSSFQFSNSLCSKKQQLTNNSITTPPANRRGVKN